MMAVLFRKLLSVNYSAVEEDDQVLDENEEK